MSTIKSARPASGVVERKRTRSAYAGNARLVYIRQPLRIDSCTGGVAEAVDGDAGRVIAFAVLVLDRAVDFMDYDAVERILREDLSRCRPRRTDALLGSDPPEPPAISKS